MAGGYGVQIFFVLSGYLAAVSLDCRHYSILSYYKRRALRILPSWYTAIFIGMMWISWKTSSEGSTLTDIFHLRWLRFFLGLNMVIPSNEWYVWNNPFGWWTMSCFIWFYIAAPFLMKFTSNLYKSILMLPICVVISQLWQYLVDFLFGNMTELEHLDYLSAKSPFVMLLYFVIGIICYHSIKEHREWPGVIAVGFIGIRGKIIGQGALFWGFIAFVAIIAALRIKFTVRYEPFRKALSFLSRQSFRIYLIHYIAYEISSEIVQNLGYSMNILYPSGILWTGFALLLIIAMTAVLNSVSKLVNRMFS